MLHRVDTFCYSVIKATKKVHSYCLHMDMMSVYFLLSLYFLLFCVLTFVSWLQVTLKDLEVQMHLRNNRVCICCHLINTEVEKTLKLRCKMTHDTIWWNARDFLLMVYMCQSCTFLRHCQPFTFMTSTIAASGIFILGAIAQGVWTMEISSGARPSRGSGGLSPRYLE